MNIAPCSSRDYNIPYTFQGPFFKERIESKSLVYAFKKQVVWFDGRNDEQNDRSLISLHLTFFSTGIDT